jgi:hypothetical protein
MGSDAADRIGPVGAAAQVGLAGSRGRQSDDQGSQPVPGPVPEVQAPPVQVIEPLWWLGPAGSGMIGGGPMRA